MRTLILLLGMAGTVAAQVPDCVINFTFTATGARSNITGCGHNTQGIVDWRMAYSNFGFSALSIQIESAPDSGGVPGSWVTWAGTVVSPGINPNTSTVQETTEVTGYYPWASVHLVSSTGSGTIKGVLYGCRQPGCAGSGSGGGGGPTSDVNLADVAGAPTVTAGVAGALAVGGIDANGALQTGNPVLVAGENMGIVNPLKQGPSGGLLPAAVNQAMIDGASNTADRPAYDKGNTPAVTPTYPFAFNGATWDRNFVCPTSAAITISAATDVVIVPLASSTITRICNVSFSSGTTSADVTIRQGTGTTCGTNQLALSGAFAAVTGLALDFTAGGLRTTLAARDVCLHFSTAVTAGGVVTYAQY